MYSTIGPDDSFFIFRINVFVSSKIIDSLLWAQRPPCHKRQIRYERLQFILFPDLPTENTLPHTPHLQLYLS
jgi:hypothetical protein